MGRHGTRASLIHRLRRIGAAALAERVAGLDGLAAEFVPQRVDRAFGQRPLARLLVDEVGRVGLAVVGQVADADAEQPVAGAVGLALEQVQAGLEDAVGKPGRVAELAVAGAQS